MRAFVKVAGIVLGSLLAVVLLAIAGSVIFSRELTEYALEKVLDREATIAGDYDVTPGKIIRIHAEDVRLANAEWAGERPFFEAQALDLAIDVPALFERRIVLPMVSLSAPKLNLARSPQGRVNWEFGVPEEPRKESSTPFNIPVISELTVDKGEIVFRDLGLASDLNGFIETLRAQVTQDAIVVNGSGQFEGNPLDFDFNLGGIAALEAASPYPVALDLIAGKTSAHIEGTLSAPLEMTGLDLTFALEGETTRELETLIGVALPALGPYRLTGKLDQRGQVWNGQIVYRAPERNTNLAIALDRVKTDDGDLLQITAEGKFRGEPARLAFKGAPLALLFDAGHRLPIDIEVDIAATQAKARGTFVAPGKTLDLDVSVSGPGTARLSKLLGVELPPLPAYAFSGHVVREEDVIKVTDLKAKVGASDAAGDVLLNTQGKKPYITSRLEIDDIALCRLRPVAKKGRR